MDFAATELEAPARHKAKGKRSREEGEKPVRKARKRGPRRETPLRRFRAQTILKRNQLRAERKKIDRELKAIEKDLGVLKRKIIIRD